MIRFNGDLAKGLLVVGKVLPEHIPERFGLLWADINALRDLEVYPVRGLLRGYAKGKIKVPDADADLYAVGITFVEVVGVLHIEIRLLRIVHRANRVSQAGQECWCGRGDLNPHGLPRQILSLVRLPFRHFRIA